ncbi:thyroid adenoma-associated protein homolog [Coccinella septempunctata]|uniref:thyroid adenoma-associated protein homolog n=1 Tax=Coccinella septempunctata TaxID=41139 RepID=UPI001D07F2B5|nr:thyroid adenoma-associated protein homolog [Coccinella septempunctata]
MVESSKKHWLDCLYVHPDVYALSQEIHDKPTDQNLKKLQAFITDDTNSLRKEDARTLFLCYVARCNANRALKNDFLNKVTKSRSDFSIFYEIVNDAIREILENYETEQAILSTKNIIHILPVVNMFYQMIKDKDEVKLLAIVEAMLPLYDAILDTLIQQLQIDFGKAYNFKNDDLLSLSHQTMKHILWIFVKMPECSLESYILAFMDYSYRILSYEKIALDMKSKCALIFLHCLKKLPEEELVNFVFKDNPLLEVTNDPKEKDSWICGKNFKFATLLDSTSAKVVLFSALYNCIPLREQFMLMLANKKCVYQSIFEEMLECTNRPVKDNGEIVEITRNLLLMSEGLNRAPIPIFENIFDKAYAYVNSYCDFPLDPVQKNSSLFLSNIVKTSCNHYRTGTEKFVDHLISTINLREGKRKIDFVTLMYLCSNMKCSFLLQRIPYLHEQLLNLLSDPSCFMNASNAYELLMSEHFNETLLEEWLSIWVRPALAQLRTVDFSITHIYHRILCKAFQLNQEILRDLFPNKYMGTPREWAVLLKCLCHARNTRMAIKLGSYDSAVYWWGLVEKSKLKLFAVQRDDMIRIAALKVVVECQKTTEYFTEWEFTYLSDYFLLNGCNQVPHLRKEIVALYKKVFTRFFASIEVIKRQVDCLRKRMAQVDIPTSESWINNFTKLNKCYKTFLKNFIGMLIDNICPDSNFYRRNAALELLTFIQSNVGNEEWANYWKGDDIENLKKILFDSYEVNKKMALGILTKMEPEKFKFHDPETYTSFMRIALSYASDIKPSKSLSAAYMFQLCCNSPLTPDDEGKLIEDRSADNDPILRMIQTVTAEFMSKYDDETPELDDITLNSPCYGLLTCLRYLIRFRPRGLWNEEYGTTYNLIFKICRRIFREVLPIVSNPAPEGYLPDNEETEISIRDDTVRSQKILVYAWRTVKEITLLFAEFVQQNRYVGEYHFLTEENYVQIGEHFMEIFVQAKHRGVFEQAYLGFCIICEEYWIYPSKDLSSLPMQWLKRGLDLVTGVKVDSRLCSTRRSAGMPFLTMAILTTDPSLDKASVRLTMKELMTAAANLDEDRMEYRTHSFNILRFLFRHSKLSDYVPPYIEKAAELALRGMQSRDWGVRNSATLLFSALITRLFGVQRSQDFEVVTTKNKMTTKVFSTRYPTLFHYLIDTLKVECTNKNSLVLQPILIFFSRLYPGYTEPEDPKLEEAKIYIRKCMASPDNETRKLAVMASISIVQPKDLHLTVRRNFEIISQKNVGNNECLALLLEAWHILKFLGDRCEVHVGKIVSDSIYILETAGTKFSHYCVSLYMEVLTFLFGNVLRYDERVDLDTLRKILTSISRLMEEQHLNLTGRLNFESAMVNLTITILLVRLEHVDTTFQAINFDFENYLTVNDGMIMKNYCLHFVLSLNISYNECGLPEPPLYIFDELTPTDSIKNVIVNFSNATKCEFLTNIHKFMVGFLRRELRRMQTTAKVDECFILVLLLLPYYSCLLETLNGGDRQRTLDMLMNFCSCDREEVMSAVVSCASVLLTTVKMDKLKTLDYRRLVRLLRRSAAPEAAIYRRLAAVQFLLKCKFLYYHGMRNLKTTHFVSILNTVLTLLEDESVKIRNEISTITDEENIVYLDEHSKTGWKCCPDKARYDFMKHCCKILPKPLSISFLISWCLRHFPDSQNEASEVFERSEHNTYAENIPYIQMTTKILNPLLWTLPYTLSYEDKSIFMEEQCQIVTIILYDAMNKFTFPMVNRKTKVAVICALRSILAYLELNQINPNFKYKFSEYFKSKILFYFKKQICNRDYHSVKKLFFLLYGPVLLSDMDYT